jgi:hypothetical protein
MNSCRKDEVDPVPEIQVLSPTENEVILLPEEIELHIKVRSAKKIKFVQVSFVNYSEVNLFEPVQFFFDSTEAEIRENIELGLLPQGFFSPYYLRITVIGGAGSHTYNHPVDFINPELQYKGLYASTRPTINTTEVYYIDANYNQTLFKTINGEYKFSATSNYQDFYYLTTDLPAEVKAFTHEDQELVWSKTAELPVPEFTAIRYIGNYLFTATANGRIRSFNALTGNSDIVSTTMTDTVPRVIQASQDHILAEFMSNNSASNMLALFYRGTGTLARKRPLNFEVADLFVGKYGFNFIVFGNESNSSLIATYMTLGNYLAESQTIIEGRIKQVVRYDEDRFFLNIENKIYLYNYLANSNLLLLEFTDEIISFKYDRVNSRIIIAFENKVQFYSYPGQKLIQEQYLPHPIKSIDLRFTYW